MGTDLGGCEGIADPLKENIHKNLWVNKRGGDLENYA